MANKNNYNYKEIDNPYNNLLERSGDNNPTKTTGTDDITVSADASDTETPSVNVIGGKTNVQSPNEMKGSVVGNKTFDNVWIDNTIKSRSYMPKKRGFLIDGRRGYIECMELFVGSGGIIGGSLDIPNKTSTNSWHVDNAGLMWSGANVANKANAPVRLNPDGTMTLGDPTGDHLQLDGPNLRIRSSDFSSGVLGKGWQIDTDQAEFQNIVARGKITTSVFEKDTVSSVGGSLMVSNSDVLGADMTALDNSTLTTTNYSFAVDEIIRMKDGVDDEWFRVTAVNGFIHTVTRDLASSYSADDNPVWTKGTAVVSMAEVGNGFISLDTSSANSPNIKIYERDSVTYNDYSTKVILGNLKDETGVDEYGLWTDNGYFQGAITGSSIDIPNSTTPLFSVDSSGNVVANSLKRDDFHWFTLFESADGFSNNASVTATSSGMRLQTTPVINTEVSIRKDVNTKNNFSWSKRRNFKTAFYFVDTVTSIRCGIFTGGTKYDNLDGIGFGIAIFNNGMTGVAGSGTDNTEVSLVTISAGQTYEIECDYVPGEYVKFYVNGVLEATITTNLPSGDLLAEEILGVELINNNVAENRNMLISYYDFWQSS